MRYITVHSRKVRQKIFWQNFFFRDISAKCYRMAGNFRWWKNAKFSPHTVHIHDKSSFRVYVRYTVLQWINNLKKWYNDHLKEIRQFTIITSLERWTQKATAPYTRGILFTTQFNAINGATHCALLKSVQHTEQQYYSYKTTEGNYYIFARTTACHLGRYKHWTGLLEWTCS